MGMDNAKFKGEDAGFAINGGKGWKSVDFRNHKIDLNGPTAQAMGDYVFVDASSGDKVRVEYTFGYKRNDDGKVVSTCTTRRCHTQRKLQVPRLSPVLCHQPRRGASDLRWSVCDWSIWLGMLPLPKALPAGVSSDSISRRPLIVLWMIYRLFVLLSLLHLVCVVNASQGAQGTHVPRYECSLILK